MSSNLPIFFNPETMPAPNGYSQVAMIPAGARLVQLAGQVGIRPDGTITGPDFAAQAEQAFENVKAGLAAAGSGFEHVIRLGMFVTDFAAQGPALRAVRDRYVNIAAPPVSTTLQVSRFFREGLLFELDVLAVVPG
ncbi:RidA family protein [Inquilinus sp. Marseille-Q2685]|uniref:RidA family protein n=1 Tax=Inquilinus sp. Marseille-Q2685 TaxID=2866581 RepID=UPI001CE4B2D0|nr:RidA family protein [Inquilinus sp. Marseille-Q2685]